MSGCGCHCPPSCKEWGGTDRRTVPEGCTHFCETGHVDNDDLVVVDGARVVEAARANALADSYADLLSSVGWPYDTVDATAFVPPMEVVQRVITLYRKADGQPETPAVRDEYLSAFETELGVWLDEVPRA